PAGRRPDTPSGSGPCPHSCPRSGTPRPTAAFTLENRLATQRLGRMLGLVAPDDDGGGRRLLLPRAGHRHLEHGPGDPGFAGADLGLVGEVVGGAHGGSVMTLPHWVSRAGGL